MLQLTGNSQNFFLNYFFETAIQVIVEGGLTDHTRENTSICLIKQENQPTIYKFKSARKRTRFMCKFIKILKQGCYNMNKFLIFSKMLFQLRGGENQFGCYFEKYLRLFLKLTKETLS